MKYPYSMKEAIGYSIILMISLWWLPVVGPIIIGYITGRKAGGPLKGIVAMLIPILLYFFVIYAIGVGWINVPGVIGSYFSGSLISVPFVPYLKDTVVKSISVGMNLQNYLYYAPPSLFIMLAFAFIGGAMSRQVILERGIYPQKKMWIKRKNKLKNEDIPPTNVMKRENKKKRKIENLEKENKIVVHPMDRKKAIKVEKKKKYGIPFL